MTSVTCSVSSRPMPSFQRGYMALGVHLAGGARHFPNLPQGSPGPVPRAGPDRATSSRRALAPAWLTHARTLLRALPRWRAWQPPARAHAPSALRTPWPCRAPPLPTVAAAAAIKPGRPVLDLGPSFPLAAIPPALGLCSVALGPAPGRVATSSRPASPHRPVAPASASRRRLTHRRATGVRATGERIPGWKPGAPPRAAAKPSRSAEAGAGTKKSSPAAPP